MLDEYMRGFQERNPSLQVFLAFLHMDESIPHMDIDFIPFITGSIITGSKQGWTQRYL